METKELEKLRSWASTLYNSNREWDYEKVRELEKTDEWGTNLKFWISEFLEDGCNWKKIGYSSDFHSCSFVGENLSCQDYPITREKALELDIPVYEDCWYYASDLIKSLGIHPSFLGFNPFIQ